MNWTKTEVIVVTGVQPCGHMILNVDGTYFHFDGPSMFNDKPTKLGNETDYKNYLIKYNKHELLRHRASILFPQKAEDKLNELLSKEWRTALIQHNCATFVREILQAGGNYTWFIEICPKGNYIVKDLIDRLLR